LGNIEETQNWTNGDRGRKKRDQGFPDSSWSVRLEHRLNNDRCRRGGVEWLQEGGKEKRHGKDNEGASVIGTKKAMRFRYTPEKGDHWKNVGKAGKRRGTDNLKRNIT